MAKRIVVEFAGETGKLDAAFAKVTKSTGSLDNAFKGLVAGAAIGSVTDQIYGAVTAASDLAESLSKSNTVFGQSGAAIDNWAKGAAEGFGLSRQAALDAAGSFGNMFVQLGIGQAEAAKMSQGMAELAADFASFHNADISQVITAQSAAFRGEYDSLQRFLPLINAASVEQEAMAATGKKNKDALTAQDKALAVNTLMFKGAGDAQGDFARTSGGLANQQRILQAEMANMRTELGEALLPAMTSATSFVSGTMIPVFEELFNLKPPTGAAGGIGAWINNLGADIAGFAAAGPQGVLRGLGNIADAVGADGLAGDFRDAADAGNDFRDRMHATTAELARADAIEAAHGANLKLVHLTQKNLIGSTDGLGKATKKTTQEIEDQEKATIKLKDAQFDQRQSSLSLEQSQHALGVAQDAYNKFLETGGIDIEKVTAAQTELVDAQKDVERATLDVAAAQDAVNKALKPATFDEQQAAAEDVAAASDAVTIAQINQTEAQDEYMRVNADSTATEAEKTRAWVAANTAARTLSEAQRTLKEMTSAQTEVSKQGTTESTAYKDAVQILTERQGTLKTATDAQTVAQGALNTAQGLGKTHAEDLWKITDDLKNAQLDLDLKTWGAQKAQMALDTATKATTVSIRNQWGNVVGLKNDLNTMPEEMTIKINTMFVDPAAALAGIQHDTGNILSGARMASGTGSNNTVNFTGVIGDPAAVARQIQSLLLEEQRRSGPAGIR